MVDSFKQERIPLRNGRGQIPVLGFGTLIADPEATCNVHEVFVRGNFGEATVRLVNQPTLENPKSSYLASLSVIATLQSVSQQFRLGT